MYYTVHPFILNIKEIAFKVFFTFKILGKEGRNLYQKPKYPRKSK